MVDSTVVRFVLKHHPDLTIIKCMESTVVRFGLKHHLASREELLASREAYFLVLEYR
jgi:hypothetical protein